MLLRRTLHWNRLRSDSVCCAALKEPRLVNNNCVTAADLIASSAPVVVTKDACVDQFCPATCCAILLLSDLLIGPARCCAFPLFSDPLLEEYLRCVAFRLCLNRRRRWSL